MKIPRDYQQYAIDLGIKRPLLLADACGLGKTLQGIEIMRPVMDGRIIILTRKLLIPQWQHALQEQGFLGVRVLTTQTPQRLENSRSSIILTNYESATRHKDLIAKMRFDGAILDEAHLVGNRKSQRTQAAQLLASRTDRKVCLTATPMTKTPAGLWSLCRWLYPRHFRSYWDWHARFVNTQKVWTPHGMRDQIIAGCRNPHELAELIAPFYLARRKEDVASELPDKIYQTVTLDMDRSQKTTYRELAEADDIVVALEHSPTTQLIQNAMTILVRQLQLTSLPRLLDIPSDGVKIDWIRSYIHDNPNTKMIVFTAFRPTAQTLANYLGDEASLVIGRSNVKPEDYKRILVATLDAAAYGLDLPDYDVAIFADAKFHPEMMYQAEERIHRIGSQNTKLIIRLVCQDSSDQLPWNAVEAGWNMWQVVQEAINRQHLRQRI